MNTTKNINNNTTPSIELNQVLIGDEKYFKISNNDFLRPFFMSIVSDSNHWMFISSNGGLTAGRKNATYALFPYTTDDKITSSAETTGSKSIFLIHDEEQTLIWEPFSIRSDGRYKVVRNLYKSIYGNKVLFEEINQDLQLTFQYEWSSSDLFGFVKNSKLINHSDGIANISILDGIQNLLPAGVNSDLQNGASNLVDAYKRCELEQPSGLGIYSLSAIIVDKAEPSESLMANTVWSLGLEDSKHLLSSSKLKHFRNGITLEEETDVKAEKGAYFVNKHISLNANEEKAWKIIADVNQSHADIAQLIDTITNKKDLDQAIKNDIALGTSKLIRLNATADGLQLTSDNLRDARHYSNSLFNIMRGGVFDNNYQIDKKDFSNYLLKANKTVFDKNEFESLSETFTLKDLKTLAEQSNDKNFKRLSLEYLPLKFSRRHGDPSRPWNKFSINTRSEVDGSKVLDYEGNWRDIFQNWEALVHAYPAFIESMIHKFLNASTFDGYNPYRVTKGGFDWETIEPDDPWSYIGYWGDHQIIYLLKFLEFIEKHYPKKLQSYFDKEYFVYANVPYKIKNYSDLLENPKDTIDFDFDLDLEIRANCKELGADASLLYDENNNIYTVNFIEKILATVLAKISNFIPGGGIWLNTQRPEWNDANNALVGNGVSMVTLYHLRRFFQFFKTILADTTIERVNLSSELIVFYKSIRNTFEDYQSLLSGDFTDVQRKKILDELGKAASDYREHVYKQGFWGKKRTITIKGLRSFIDLGLEFMEHSINANKRKDHLYHAYNLMTVEDNKKEVSVSYLSEMLEGQVAVLSSGYLSSTDALNVLDALKNSKLFREDQYSYILYPNKELPRFTNKNTVPKDKVEASELLTLMSMRGNNALIEKNIKGEYHFNGEFKNGKALEKALDSLENPLFVSLVEKEKKQILDIYEEVFNHKAFTGRSGTFFGYEGLGSIYWHMVSKLLLAVQECCLKAIKDNESEFVIGGLLEHYYEINEGIGVHKSPSLYGAFPTDPYSHTPGNKGVQQPGMTGQVKEDILSRFGELGVFVEEGKINFNPCLLRDIEFLDSAQEFKYMNVNSKLHTIEIGQGSLCFTYCQIPIVFTMGTQDKIEIHYRNEKEKTIDNLQLDEETSQQMFDRTGLITQINATINKTILK